MVVVKLFTSPTCPYCPKAAKVVEKVVSEEKVMAVELPVNTDRGMQEALKFGIRAVPAIVVNDEYVMFGVPDERELRMLIRRLRGDVNEAS